MEVRKFSGDHPPTFGEMLRLIVSGESQGFTVFSDEFGMSFTIFEPGSVIDTPGPGETWIPMTAEVAAEMIRDLEEDTDELDEVGHRPTRDETNQN